MPTTDIENHNDIQLADGVTAHHGSPDLEHASDMINTHDDIQLAPGVESVGGDADNNQPSIYAKENDLLQPIGKSKMVGNEKPLFDEGKYKAGMASYGWNNKRSIRYLHHDEEGNPIGALQLMTQGPRTKKAVIQNVYVAEDHRRKNIASGLLKRARQDFDVKHSKDLTAQGRAFAKATKAYGGAIPGPKLTEENADDFARRLIAWTFATAPLFQRAAGGEVTYPVAMPTEIKEDIKAGNAKMKHLSPQEFLDEADTLHIGKGDRHIINSFEKHIKSGDHLGPLKLYEGGHQDGRHRANAAKDLGVKKVPVIDYRKADGGSVIDAALDVVSNLRR